MGELDILTLTERQVAFGYSSEELDVILKPMLKEGAEPYGSMGDDTALAVLSLQPRLLYTYFLPAFRAGHEPAHRPVARATGHVAEYDHGLAAQPVR